jgi:hypothetical protein
MAYAINRCMAYDLPVVLRDAHGSVLAEGLITHRMADEHYGVLVRIDGADIGLPFIHKLELKEATDGNSGS